MTLEFFHIHALLLPKGGREVLHLGSEGTLNVFGRQLFILEVAEEEEGGKTCAWTEGIFWIRA